MTYISFTYDTYHFLTLLHCSFIASKYKQTTKFTTFPEQKTVKDWNFQIIFWSTKSSFCLESPNLRNVFLFIRIVFLLSFKKFQLFEFGWSYYQVIAFWTTYMIFRFFFIFAKTDFLWIGEWQPIISCELLHHQSKFHIDTNNIFCKFVNETRDINNQIIFLDLQKPSKEITKMTQKQF